MVANGIEQTVEEALNHSQEKPVEDSHGYGPKYHVYSGRKGSLHLPLFVKVLEYRPSEEEVQYAHLVFACNRDFKGPSDDHHYQTLASLLAVVSGEDRRLTASRKAYDPFKNASYLSRELLLMADFYHSAKKAAKLELVSSYPSGGHEI